MISKLNKTKWAGFENWQVPTEPIFAEFKAKKNPLYYLNDGNHSIYFHKDSTYYSFLVIRNNTYTRMDFDNFCKNSGTIYSSDGGFLYPVCPVFDLDIYNPQAAVVSASISLDKRLTAVIDVFDRYALLPYITAQDHLTHAFALRAQLKQHLVSYQTTLAEVKRLAEIKRQEEAKQPKSLSAGFDYKLLLKQYDVVASNESIFQFNRNLQAVIDELLLRMNEFEVKHHGLIDKCNHAKLRFAQEYEPSKQLDATANQVLAQRYALIRHKFDFGLESARLDLAGMTQQLKNSQLEIERCNRSSDSLLQLATYLQLPRPSFALAVENAVNIVISEVARLEFYNTQQNLVDSIIQQDQNWQEAIKVLFSTYHQELESECLDKGIEAEIYQPIFADWVKERLLLEQKFTELIEYAIDKQAFTYNYQQQNCLVAILKLLQDYKLRLDKFYREERIAIHEKYAFQAQGSLQERYEAELEMYKFSSQLQQNLVQVIFAIPNLNDKLFMVRWANQLVANYIDDILAITTQVTSSSAISEILTGLQQVKQMTLERYLSDVNAYSQALKAREKEFDSLVYKLRKNVSKN